jgi:hypothetical protein
MSELSMLVGRFGAMKLGRVGMFLGFFIALTVATVWADGLIVYGDRWAMTIVEPSGWVGDCAAGAADGMNIVFYPKGSSWSEAPVVIYGMVLDIKPAEIKHQRQEDRRLNEEHYGKQIKWRDIAINKPYNVGQVYEAAEVYANAYEKMVWIGDEKSNVVVLFVLNAHGGKKPQKNIMDLFEAVIRSVVLTQKE